MTESPSTAKSTETFQMPQDTPPAFINRLMKWMLTTPGIQTMVGQGVALLTYTGRHSGKRYVLPVSYHRVGDTITLVTKKARTWWRNFETPAEVGLRLAGKEYHGIAEAGLGDEETLAFMTGYLKERPIDAKAYGLDKNDITTGKVAQIIPHIVVIRIEIGPID